MVGRSAQACRRRRVRCVILPGKRRPLLPPAKCRRGGRSASEPSLEQAGPAPGAPPQLDPQLARIAEAVAAERMEVLLEPIHALVEGRPRHFEVSMRLLTADGARSISATTRGRRWARA